MASCRYRELSGTIAGVPLYAVALNAQTQNCRVVEGAKVTPAEANSVLLGSEYVWDCEASDQSRSQGDSKEKEMFEKHHGVDGNWCYLENDAESRRGYGRFLYCTNQQCRLSIMAVKYLADLQQNLDHLGSRGTPKQTMGKPA